MSTKHLSQPARLRSHLGVNALIAQATSRREADLLGQAFSPLFPEDAPWSKLSSIPREQAREHKAQLRDIAVAVLNYRKSLTATAGELECVLDIDEEDVRKMALDFARLDLSERPDDLERLAKYVPFLPKIPCEREFPGLFLFVMRPGLPECPWRTKLMWAEHFLGEPVPGDDEAAKISRIADARFWRRAIRVRLMREREHFFLRLRLVGNQAEAYVSDMQLGLRQAQLKRQAEWMKQTVLVPRFLAPGSSDSVLTLEKVATSARTRFAKLYSFVQAVDAIGIEQGLSTAMLTLTLEPEWHPNPSHGNNSWNGKNPRQAHRAMGRRWQSALRDLDRYGIGLSGLRVTEPHQDACPHWHIWLLYRPDAEQRILETVMRYFPHKLKVCTPIMKRGKSGKPGQQDKNQKFNTVMYDTLGELSAGVSRAARHAKEGAQVELARIDRRISSGASYAMKYLLKTVDGGDTLNAQVGLFASGAQAIQPELQTSLFGESAGSSTTLAPKSSPKQEAQLQKKRQQHLATAKRVDAYRSLWGINAGQLFGVAKCLTAWDELRRLSTAPKHPLLKTLWALARGTDKEGRIGAGESIRGNAKGFIEALGGIAACGKAAKGAATVSIGRLTEEAKNSYGETITRTIGVTLVERSRVRVAVGTYTSRVTGEIKPKMAWRMAHRTIAEQVTHSGEWTLVTTQSPLEEGKDVASDPKVQSAIALAEQRYTVLLNAESPEQLRKRFAHTFWTGVWEAAPPQPKEDKFSPKNFSAKQLRAFAAMSFFAQLIAFETRPQEPEHVLPPLWQL